MASTTSGSLPSSPSLPGTGAEQEFSSVDPHGLFLPSSPSPASLYFDHDSSFQGFLPTSSPTRATATPPHPTAPSKPPKKRLRASRRPPTTVLTTDTSNFRAMVQEFTGFPAPPFAAGPSPFVRPRLLGGASAYGPPFLVRPCPLKYPQQNPALLSSIGTGTTTGGGANSLMHALALLARSNAMPSTPADVTTARGSVAADQYGGHHGHGMGDFNFNPFDDFETETAAAVEGDKTANGDHAGFFSSLGGAGDKYDRH
ncbi:uncharacterized protein [Triticum aestivum]|uniref:uncharacterized protein n=1 Tax=Triticum aestivum TaxID=4565 RepID=UPI001949ECE5|nr:uncharacterized protein LOC123076891 [Triticum aestivum]